MTDIFAIEIVNVIRASGPVTPGNLTRGPNVIPSHHLADCCGIVSRPCAPS